MVSFISCFKFRLIEVKYVGQILLTIEDKGRYKEHGKSTQVLTTGMTVTIPKDVEHWHVASADSKIVHIVISNMKEGNTVTWKTQVINEDMPK